ncbi:MAG: 2Fe-2S iron-sulfur cluster-binding protein [Bacteroidetes bacterium]|nr:2Fe-2S iron-sulfur cluster-binding protein [Bacteroidota bacterium]MDE2671724.1 2Fe-2S iron-sulfur cluster-binding protein [Bacteroidota bacterium]
MPKVTIDGEEYAFEGQPGLLQFCLDHGIELPHFCYHPSMSVPANCRQCLVDVGAPVRDRKTGEFQLEENGEKVIRYFPKLQTSCSHVISDGQVVHTARTSEKVERAQRDTMEFLLINHPLDCPICDQAGHCPLQIQAYKYGPEGSRFEFRKVHKPKKVKLGPNVVLDAERCINCTRCVRFTDEISRSGQLTIIERGVKNYPITPPGVSFDEPYSMNVIDLCPVGALTSADFRFQARIWEMASTPSITTTNAKGSNCYLWVRDNLVMRITPRPNPDVNEFWIPDEDRLTYRWFNENRPCGPAALSKSGACPWDEAIQETAETLRNTGKETLFLASARATVEDNWMLMQLAEAVGGQVAGYIPHIEQGHGDGWLRTDDRTPNSQGCERLGLRPVDMEVWGARLNAGEVQGLYVLEDDPVTAGLCSAQALENVQVILHYYNTTNQTLPAANVALPAATVAETIGTYVNEAGRAQRVVPAKVIKGVNRTLMMQMGLSRADQHGTPFDRWHNESHYVDCKPSWEIIPLIARNLDVEIAAQSPKKIMQHISASNPAFAGATYKAMGLSGVTLPPIEIEVVS